MTVLAVPEVCPLVAVAEVAACWFAWARLVYMRFCLTGEATGAPTAAGARMGAGI